MKKHLLTIVAILTSFVITFACLWDKDTIEMEMRSFPSAMELITGKFLRHSDEFYTWRIKHRKELLNTFPDSLKLYDDLAVAYSKLKQDKKAIEIILKKEELSPRLYETYANLGTFYLHDGQFEEGIKYIHKALKINPEAHFGRERYQLWLAEYILLKKKEGAISFPLDSGYIRFERSNSFNFYEFVLQKVNTQKDSLERKRYLTEVERKLAVKGVLGMMKFGNHDSPILLEVLGDLLCAGYDEAARILGSMAYLRASQLVGINKDMYYRKIHGALEIQIFKEVKSGNPQTKFKYIEKLLALQLDSAQVYYDSIKNDEIQWITSGLNPEEEFDIKYYGKERSIVDKSKQNIMDTISKDTLTTNSDVTPSSQDNPGFILYVLVGLFIGGGILWYWKSRS